MRAIWKGAVSFGLVSISVKLYSATEEKDIRFHQVHRADGGRIKYQRVCSVCGEQVSFDQIAKGFDVGGGEIVVLTDADFKDLPLTSTRAIEVLEFVPSEQIDPIFYAKAYYLEPDGAAGLKPYLLLRDSLTHVDRVAVVKVALRQRETLATVRVRDGVLVLNTMLWPDEVRKPEFAFLDDDTKLRPQELKMAESLIDSMAGDFNPDVFTDSYREALQQVIDVKIGKQDTIIQPTTEEPVAPTIDLMAALRASVERARAARDEPADRGKPATVTSIKSAASAKSAAASKKAAPASAESSDEAAPAKSTASAKSASAKATSAKATPSKTAAKKTAEKAAPAKSAAKKTAAATKAEPAKKAAAKKTAAATKTPARKTMTASVKKTAAASKTPTRKTMTASVKKTAAASKTPTRKTMSDSVKKTAAASKPSARKTATASVKKSAAAKKKAA
jgi:DNA end-binding protein Ku